MNKVIKEIKTLNYRLMKLGLLEDFMVSGSFYNQFKILYDNLLFDIQVQITEHVQTSTQMLQGYNSYLNDYKATDDPSADDYVKG